MDYRELTRRLIRLCRAYRDENDRLASELGAWEESYDGARDRAEATEASNVRRIRALEEERRQAEADASYHAEQVRSATRELERARSWGDVYGESRALDKLRRLS